MGTILVTGAAGFIGSNLAMALVGRGDTVVGLDNLSQGSWRNLESLRDAPGFRLVEGDVRDADLVAATAADCDAIVHLAAFKIPRYGNALATLDVNSVGTVNVLEAARARRIRVILASTSDVYGRNPALPFAESSDCWLGSSTVKRWAYATSKLYDEHLGFAYQQSHGVPVTVVRFFGGYGPGQHRSWWGGPQSVFIAAALAGQPMTIHGDGLQTRSFTFISDHVAGLLRCLDLPAAAGEVFNLGSEEEVTILELARLIWSMVRSDEPRLQFVSYASFGKYEDVQRRLPDPGHAARVLGFRACVPLREGLARTIAWQRQLAAEAAPA